VLASGAFYTSGTFWGVAGVAVAVLAILVSVVLWRLGGPRRVLTYSVPVATPLLRGSPRFLRGQVEVTLGGLPMKDPCCRLARRQQEPPGHPQR
jgi:hypothetical protein